jgi:imidazolonepropionase-like amidohydrolase
VELGDGPQSILVGQHQLLLEAPPRVAGEPIGHPGDVVRIGHPVEQGGVGGGEEHQLDAVDHLAERAGELDRLAGHVDQRLVVPGVGGVASQYPDARSRIRTGVTIREKHRAGLKVAAHAHGDDGIRAAVEAGIDCIEHGSLMSDETLDLLADRGTFLVPTTYLADGMDVSRAAPELQAKAAEVFPRARETIRKAVARGARIACGTDAPAIPHGKNAKELIALVDRGMTPLDAIRAATVVSAELIDVDDRGRLEPGLLADVIAVPGDVLADITVTEAVRFVMKGGQIHRHD